MGHGGKVEIFDKFNEFSMAGIYVAIRIFYPNLYVTRIGILKALSIRVTSSGNVSTDMFDVQDISLDLMKKIQRGELDLEEFARKALAFSVD